MSEKSLVLKTIRNPFDRSDSEIRYYPIPKCFPTLEEVLQEIFPLYPEFIISVNGRVIDRTDYDKIIIREGDWILAYPTVHGGEGGGGKDFLRLAALIALTVASTYIGPEAAMAAKGMGLITAAQVGTYQMAVTIGLMVVGGLLVNALLPTKLPETNTPEITQSPTRKWSPKTTQQQGLVVPKFYGVNKLVGNVISNYTETLGNEQVINFLLSLGIGPYYRLYDFKINDQFLYDIPGVEIHSRLGYLSQDIIPNFNDTKTETTYANCLITYNSPQIQSSPSNDFDDLEIEISFPGGLSQLVSTYGRMENVTVDVQVEIRKLGDSEWIPISISSSTVTDKIFTGKWSAGFWETSADTGWGGPISTKRWVELSTGPTDPNAHYEGEIYTETVDGAWGIPIVSVRGIWRWIGSETETTFDTITAYKRFTNNVSTPITHVFTPPAGLISADKGYYEIRVQRLTEDRASGSLEVTIVDKVYLKAVREIYFDDFIHPREVLVGVKGTTSEVISGSLDFSCMAQGAIVRTYNGSSWAIEYSNNPAWVAYDILTQPVFNDALTEVLRYDGLNPSKLNTASFKAWADFCDEEVSSVNSQSEVIGTDGNSYRCILDHVSNVRNKPVQGGIDNLCQSMISNSAPSGYTVSASNTFNGLSDYLPYKAFDRQNGTMWVSGAKLEGVWWLAYEFSEAKHIQKYTITPYDHPAYRPFSWIFQGWDGDSWVNLDTHTNYQWPYNGKREFSFTTAESYTKYRLYVTEVDPGPFYDWHQYDPSDPSSAINLYMKWPTTVGVCVAISEMELIDTDTSWSTYWELGGSATNGWLAGRNYYKGQEKRITFNGGFDTESSAWEAALKVAYVGRATLFRDGSVIKVAVDKAADPVQLFSVGDIYIDSFNETFIPFGDRASELEIDFINSENDYQRDKLSWYNSNITNVTKKATIDAFGLTSPSEVQRFARYILAGNQYLIRRVGFDVDIEALACEIGDVFYLQHDVPEWGEGGRVVSATSNSITLDHEVTMVEGTTYKILVRILVDDSIEEKTITPSPGTHSTIYIVGSFTTIPSKYDIYSFGTSALVAKKFKLVNIRKTMDNKITLEGIEYNPLLYTTDDEELTLPLITAPAPDKSVDITDLNLSERSYLDESGNIKRSIVVRFSVGTSTIYQYAEVRYYDGYVWRNAGTTRGFNLEIPDVIPDTTYTVMVIGVNVVGAKVNINKAPTSTIKTSSRHEAGYSTVVGKVSGLKVFEEGDPDTFTGRDCKLVWNRLSGIDDTSVGAGEEVGGAASLVPNMWLLDYKVVVSVDGITRRTEYVTQETYTYTFEKNYEDGNGTVANSFTVSVTARDKYYRESAVSASITVSNSSPADVGTITATGYEDGVSFTWNPSSDSDIRGYKVRTRVESGSWSDWTENSKNEYYRDLTGTEMIAQGWGNSNVQIEVKAIDAYENISANSSTSNTDCLNKKSYLTVGSSSDVGVFTTIAAAIAALPEDGGAIFIKNGTYIEDEITIPDKNLNIMGESRDGVIVQSTDNKDLFVMTDRTKTFQFSDFSITSGNSTGSNKKMFNISGNDTTATVMVDNLKITGNKTTDYGIYANSTSTSGKIEINDCEFIGSSSSTSTYFVSITWSSNISVLRNKCYTGAMIHCNGGHIEIGGNQLFDLGYGGVYVSGSYTTLKIVGNKYVMDETPVAAAVNTAPIYLYITGTAHDTMIEQNEIDINIGSVSNYVDGMYIFPGNAYRMSVSYNRINIAHDGEGDLGALGIDLVISRNGKVTGNIIKVDSNADVRYGIKGTWYNMNISDNNIDMVNSDETDDIGIHVSGNTNYGSGNTIINAGVQISDNGTGNEINKWVGGTF